ncbi:MAG TPA: chlorinating enzyme [Polyangiaceae bacterium]|nr:chlorinating enzyme [Polyangiaceae bacterium]
MQQVERLPSATSGETDERIRTFWEDGFIGPIPVYSPEEARELLQRIRIANVDRERILFDNDVNYDRHFDISELTRHIGRPQIVEVVRQLLGKDLLCWRSEFFPKFPGTAGTEWHQVTNYQYATGSPMLKATRPAAHGLLDLTVWTAFTDCNRENGCMKFLPGSHKHAYYDESRSVSAGRNGGYRSVTAGTSFFGYNFEDFKVDPSWIPDESAAVSMEMKAGECVIFSARCVHASHPNTTRRTTRFAITSRYVATHVRVYPDWSRFEAHGGAFELADWGTVLVSGKDDFGHNRLRTHNNRGEAFPHLV